MSKRIITNRQRLILMLLYTFRFLNSKQIQEFLGHKDHRRINSWLKDLGDKGFIERDFKVVFGTQIKPAVYYLATLGRNDIKKGHVYHFPNYLRKISRDNKASKSFRIKCQIIADWYLTTIPSVNTNVGQKNTGIDIIDHLEQILTYNPENIKNPFPPNKVQFFTSSYYPDFPLLNLKQDAYMRRKTSKGIEHGLLFVIDAYIPRFLLRYTIKRIFETIDEESWEEQTKPLQLFFLCPNNQIIIYMKKLLIQPLENYWGQTPITFNFATRNQLYKKKEGKIEKVPWTTLSTDTNG